MQNNLNTFLKQFYITNKNISKELNSFFNTFNITLQNYLVLSCLSKSKPLYLQEICDSLSLDTSTMTPASKRLEKKGIIKRERSELDERKILISLTEKGKELQDDINHSMDDLIQKINTPELNDYIELLTKITNHN
ncbi:transcriptional regulator [Staphylococcus xylosus]|uniref:MarR family winged helix-turn-helix transcriptional regulator n=1 Tax=Staphylococcus xylosus TaxID=1288 RepID=UPI00085C982A|nr:MarR family transcriptional regulator [Staphylococcus xylosus]SCU36816.1 transcriptional regulator [Staphylococcus xylosus]